MLRAAVSIWCPLPTGSQYVYESLKPQQAARLEGLDFGISFKNFRGRESVCIATRHAASGFTANRLDCSVEMLATQSLFVWKLLPLTTTDIDTSVIVSIVLNPSNIWQGSDCSTGLKLE